MLVVDLIALLVCSLGLHRSISLPLPSHLLCGGNWQFLTNVGALGTNIFILANILIPNHKFTWYFYHIISPIECAITFGYWSTVFLFPNNLNTDSFDVDLWLDFQIHLLPYVYLLLVTKPRISYKRSLVLEVLGLGGYWCYIEYLMKVNDGFVPYPFLRGLSLPGRLLHLARFIILAQFNYVFQRLKCVL